MRCGTHSCVDSGACSPGKIGKMTGIFGDHYKNAERVRIQVEAFRN
ncbi:hypothetical protein MU582_20815 [Nocardioidaceae bacterium SCSIO 66511]|nr:hypothetical protein MU582_20815 [Nocardioidaceae bacterium SCSIO 66511]